MSENREIVTIDGPSGVGKSTISRKVAAALGYMYLDTGAMYRGVAWFLRQQGIDLADTAAVEGALDRLELELIPTGDRPGDVGVRICGQEVGAAIRTPEMSMAASAVSRLAPVRARLTAMQQRIGARGRIVAEGRDTGTVVFPGAAYKFFLDATPQERARRRVLQLREQGQQVEESEILAMTIERDTNDRQRALAPLCKAEDAVLVDTTELDIEMVCQRVLAAIREKKD